MFPWVTVWGYGVDISASAHMLYVREKGMSVPKRYVLSEITHLLIAGDNILHTSAVIQCAKYNISISFFDIHGHPVSRVEDGNVSKKSSPEFISAHAYAKSMITSSMDARMRYLHELSEVHRDFYLNGEFDILTESRNELEFLITLPELARLFLLTKTMYYEILSRVLPSSLGFKRRIGGEIGDPVNVLFSKGYAMLYATVQTACIGAGLDLSRSSVFGKVLPCVGHPCVHEIMEPALVSMVDRSVIKTAFHADLEKAYRQGNRWILPSAVDNELYQRLSSSLDVSSIEMNVFAYASALHENKIPQYHYPA